MRYSLVLILVSVLTGCSSKSERPISGVDAEIAPYYDKFSQIYQVDPYAVPAAFSDLAGNMLGVCKMNTDGEAWILVDQEWWTHATEMAREQLIFHELGHCLMGKPHDDTYMPDGFCPSSIMNKDHMSTYCYAKYYDHYLEQLGR